jgi:hypothetical protein
MAPGRTHYYLRRMAILTAPVESSKSTERKNISQDAAVQRAWRLLGWIGLAFVVMGATDVLLAWYPAAFGRPEWEFGAITASLNGLALPILGLFFLLAAASANRSFAVARILGTTLFALAAGLLVVAFIYATVVPLALGSVADNAQIAAGMKKAIVKAVILIVSYVTLLVTGGISGWRLRKLG